MLTGTHLSGRATSSREQTLKRHIKALQHMATIVVNIIRCSRESEPVSALSEALARSAVA